MSIFSGKKFLLIGFIVVLLIAIPITIYLVQQQQETRGRAQPATTLTLTATPSNVALNGNVEVSFRVNPAQNNIINSVGSVKFKIIYDSSKLSASADGFTLKSWTAADGRTPISPSFFQTPIYEDGSIRGVIAVGPNPQNAIVASTEIAKITFKAIGATAPGSTQVRFDTTNDSSGQANTAVYSITGESAANENVLSTTLPATITITDAAPTTIPTPTPTIAASPTLAPTVAPTATPTPGIANQSPACNDLALSASGSAVPLTATLIANGTDADGTINKVTFNFGDGTTQDVTAGGGIGSNSVNVSTTHIYNSAGTFTASALLTDSSGGQSSSTVCSETITVAQAGAPTATPAPTTVATSPAPTLPPTGPGQTMLFIGALGAIISAIGAFLLLAL